MTAARRARESLELIRQSLVDGFGVFQDRFGDLPRAVAVKMEKTAMAAGVTGDRRFMPELSDLQQEHVVVAIHAYFVHGLHVARLLALEPKLAARAAEVHRPPEFSGLLQGFAVHPGEHQHVIAADLLGNDGNKALR